MRRWRHGPKRRGPAPSPYVEAPRSATEHRELPKIIERPIRCGSQLEVAALMGIYNDDVKAALRQGQSERRAGYAALSHPEQEGADV